MGRGVVVNAGQEVPAAWRDASRVEVDEAVLAEPAAVVDALHRAWAARVAVAVSLGVDPARFRRPVSVHAEPWTLGAGFEPWEDRLQFLVWANNYDARSGEPVWWWARKAFRLGARPPEAGDPGVGDVDFGDVVLPDGRPAWIDGGPRGGLAELVAGAVVVHREVVERGHLHVERAEPPVADAAALAPDQLAAVAHPSGPARIIAPAGSGKTRVLTARLRHLLAGRGWDAEGVLAVAYNRKAQQELDARCAGLGLRTRTLNSLGLWLLTRARGGAPRVLDEREVRRIVESLAPIRRQRANTDPVGPYLEALGTVRLGLVDPEEVEASRDDVPGLAELFPRYRAELAEAGSVDFDEQIYGAIEALLADGEFRTDAQRFGRHLLVDEFQDLTPGHVLLLRLLCLPGLDVFGVGDDDQVIYGHAGADPGFLIDYDRYFPTAASHPLEVNYRCPAAVVTAATHLLSYNERRVDKVIRAADTRQGPTGLAVREHAPTDGAATLVAAVRSWLDAGVAPADIAVLTRVNALLLAPVVALSEAGVAVNSVLRPDVLERTGLRAALAWSRIATAADGGVDSRDLVEILRRPSRGFPPWFADRLRRRRSWSLDALAALSGSVPEKDAVRVERLVDDVLVLRGVAKAGRADRLVRAIRDDIGLGSAMSLLDQSRGVEGSSHLDDLEALEQVAALHPDPGSFEGWLREAFCPTPDPDGVVLSTVHRVKGMEWPRVAVYGANGGLMPHRLADDEEEERRVLHVAITRGRDEVVVLADRTRPSMFLAELDGSAPHEARPAPAAVVVRPAGGGPKGGGSNGGGSKGGGSNGGGSKGGDELPAEAAELAERLRTWRRERAKADGVPAYIVFNDRTLRGIATARPGSLKALLAVEGIGPNKLDLYGDEILGVVAG